MAIPAHHKKNFQTLISAAQAGDLALLECLDAVTGDKRFVLCAVGRDGGGYALTPFGHLTDGNPFEAYISPIDNDGSGVMATT